MVKTIPYEELMHLLRPNNPMPMRTRALITFQYTSAARIGELLAYKHKIVDPKETKERKEYFIKHKDRIKKERKFVYYRSNGLLKSNFFRGKNKISWKMPNFKTKNKHKQFKEPFVLKEEKLLWRIITAWLDDCGEQVFDLKESRVRQLLREKLKPYSSHVLRSSRGTHLANIFMFNAYDIRDSLGHISIETGTHYISTAGRENKMREKLLEMELEKDV